MGVSASRIAHLNQRPPLSFKVHALGVTLGLIAFTWLAVTSPQIGIPRDESIYIYAADRFAQWFDRAIEGSVDTEQSYSPWSDRELERGFGFNHEHPMLMKALFGLSHRYLHQKWGWVSDPVLAYRLPTLLMAALAVYLTTLLGVMLGGLWVGGVSAVLLMSMPRLFFHAHLACFDLPVTTMWLSICLTYLLALHHRGWIVGTGVVLGLGLATKLNTFFAPFILLILSLVHVFALARSRRKLWVVRYSWIALSMVVLGLGVFFLHWPWLYRDTVSRMTSYIQFHAHHVHYPVDYLGTLFYRPPFPLHFPFVFTLLTLPVATLALCAVGGFRVFRLGVARWSDHAEDRGDLSQYPIELFIILNALIPLLIIALPTTPIFGGTKHWMPAMPFWAVLGGLGAKWMCAELNLTRGYFKGALLTLILAPGIWLTHSYGPHGPAWYNSLAGGVPGAADLRMPRNFWGYSSMEILPHLNQHARRRDGVFWHNATGMSVHQYKRSGRLRRDITSTGDWTYPYATWGIYHDQREKHLEETDLWWAYETELPVDGFFIDGVQQIGVYRRMD